MKNPLSIGIDIGATKTNIGLIDSNGSILEKNTLKTNLDSSSMLTELHARIETLMLKSPKTIGIGAAAQVDSAKGLLLSSPNLKWKNLPLKDQFPLPTYLTNDVRAATFAEWKFGAGKGCDHFVCLFFGSGVGGGVVSHGHLLEGATFAAAELGHIIVDPNGPLCGCGNHGCLEAFASGIALSKNPNLDQAKKAIETALISIIHSFNPEKIIFGGGLYEGMPDLFSGLFKKVQKRIFGTSLKKLSFTSASLKNDAGMVGAANLAFSKFFSTH